MVYVVWFLNLCLNFQNSSQHGNVHLAVLFLGHLLSRAAASWPAPRWLLLSLSVAAVHPSWGVFAARCVRALASWILCLPLVAYCPAFSPVASWRNWTNVSDLPGLKVFFSRITVEKTVVVLTSSSFLSFVSAEKFKYSSSVFNISSPLDFYTVS